MTNYPQHERYLHNPPQKSLVSRVLGELVRVRPKDLLHPFNDPRAVEDWNTSQNSGYPSSRRLDSRPSTASPYSNPNSPRRDSHAGVPRAYETAGRDTHIMPEHGYSDYHAGPASSFQPAQPADENSGAPSNASKPAPSPKPKSTSATNRAFSTEITATSHDDGLAPLVVGDAGAEVDPIIVDAKFGTGRQVPDTVIDGWRSKQFAMRSVSLRGRMHRYNGAPRQDSVLTLLSDDGNTLFVAVADGVSAAPQSHRGSAIAARYAIGWLKKMYKDNLSQQEWISLAKGASYSIQTAAKEAGEDPMDFASTLVCAAISKHGTGLRGHVLSIGDSGSWTVTANGVELIEGGKEESDSAISSSAVNPLPLVPENLTAVYFESAGDETVLFGTDGIGDPLGGGGGPLSDLFVKRLYKRVPSTTEFCHLVDFSKAGFDDDRTLVAIWPAHIGVPDS